MTAVLHGDCLAILPTLPPDSFDSCVTDPPYHLVSIVKRFGKSNLVRDPKTLQPIQGKQSTSQYGRLSTGFMGKQWDGGDVAARVETWAAVYRALKPGAHLVAFGGTRTYHRMACAIEDAGFEIRDCIQWIYGSGFPKSHNAGNGWGTALKPACEPIVLARKPLSEGTVAANVLRWGTGAINVDGCRVEAADQDELTASREAFAQSDIHTKTNIGGRFLASKTIIPNMTPGRWPANVVHDGSDEVVQGFPESESNGCDRIRSTGDVYGEHKHTPFDGYYDSGSAARFFYTAKADGDERIGSKHPTVKPIDLMQWLVRLVTPKGGSVLDPFAGTGTTGEAAWREGCHATLIEREAEYLADIARRLELMKAGPDERRRESLKASGKAQGHEDLPLFDRAWADMWAKPFDRPELVWGEK